MFIRLSTPQHDIERFNKGLTEIIAECQARVKDGTFDPRDGTKIVILTNLNYLEHGAAYGRREILRSVDGFEMEIEQFPTHIISPSGSDFHDSSTTAVILRPRKFTYTKREVYRYNSSTTTSGFLEKGLNLLTPLEYDYYSHKGVKIGIARYAL